MAKRKARKKTKAPAKGKEQNLYLLAIVSIVAIVGVVVLILNAGSSGTVELYDEDGNLIGEAFRSGMISDRYVTTLKVPGYDAGIALYDEDDDEDEPEEPAPEDEPETPEDEDEDDTGSGDTGQDCTSYCAYKCATSDISSCSCGGTKYVCAG